MNHSRWIPNQTYSNVSMNLTSLADMFTILLAFLLYNMVNNPVSPKLDKISNLPVSQYFNPASTEAFIITLKDNHIWMNDRLIANTDKIRPEDFLSMKDEIKNSKVLIVASKSTSYSQIKQVLYLLKSLGIQKISIAAVLNQ